MSKGGALVKVTLASSGHVMFFRVALETGEGRKGEREREREFKSLASFRAFFFALSFTFNEVS